MRRAYLKPVFIDWIEAMQFEAGGGGSGGGGGCPTASLADLADEIQRHQRP